MTRYSVIFSAMLLVFMTASVILLWNITALFTHLCSLFSGAESHALQDINRTMQEEVIGNTTPFRVTNTPTDPGKTGHYETMEETIARIRRDVNVTGVILGSPGEEIAFFEIEGLPDRPFQIHTQLKDGLMITEITNNAVVLKNQMGDETFFLIPGKNSRPPSGFQFRE